jgi:hypothetical protein
MRVFRDSGFPQRKRQRPWGLWRFILEELAVSKSAAASSGYRLANPRFAPAICLSASPSDRPPTCVGDLSPALPSNSTTDPHRPSDPSTCPQISPPTCVGDQPSGLPSSQPSTCVSGQLSGPAFAPTCDLRRLPILQPAFRPISSLRLQPIFRTNLPADFQLAPWSNLPVPPSNLTSDSHRPPIPSALLSSQPAACAADQPSSPA